MNKKITMDLGILFLILIVGVIAISTLRSSESYKRKQAGQGAPITGGINLPNSSSVVDEGRTQLSENENIEKSKL